MAHPLTTEARQTTSTTTGNGSANAAEIDLGRTSTKVDVFVDSSGAANLTVEVSATGEFNGEEREADTNSYGSAATDFRQYDFAYQHVRAYLDTATNTLEIVGRGV